jgi:hypothetical protein
MLFAIVCLKEIEVPWQMVVICHSWGDSIFIFFGLLLFKDMNVFVVGWHVSKRNLNTKKK